MSVYSDTVLGDVCVVMCVCRQTVFYCRGRQLVISAFWQSSVDGFVDSFTALLRTEQLPLTAQENFLFTTHWHVHCYCALRTHAGIFRHATGAHPRA